MSTDATDTRPHSNSSLQGRAGYAPAWSFGVLEGYEPAHVSLAGAFEGVAVPEPALECHSALSAVLFEELASLYRPVTHAMTQRCTLPLVEALGLLRAAATFHAATAPNGSLGGVEPAGNRGAVTTLWNTAQPCPDRAADLHRSMVQQCTLFAESAVLGVQGWETDGGFVVDLSQPGATSAAGVAARCRAARGVLWYAYDLLQHITGMETTPHMLVPGEVTEATAAQWVALGDAFFLLLRLSCKLHHKLSGGCAAPPAGSVTPTVCDALMPVVLKARACFRAAYNGFKAAMDVASVHAGAPSTVYNYRSDGSVSATPVASPRDVKAAAKAAKGCKVNIAAVEARWAELSELAGTLLRIEAMARVRRVDDKARLEEQSPTAAQELLLT